MSSAMLVLLVVASVDLVLIAVGVVSIPATMIGSASGVVLVMLAFLPLSRVTTPTGKLRLRPEFVGDADTTRRAVRWAGLVGVGILLFLPGIISDIGAGVFYVFWYMNRDYYASKLRGGGAMSDGPLG